MNFKIRIAEEKDALACHDIYGAYVDGLNVTFTIENPSVEKYREKIVNTKKKYPFYVAQDESGKILGYCCGEPLRPHDAPRRSGIATALYERFSATLRKQNFQYIYAVIVDTNEASLEFHRSLGFEKVGHFHNAGIKKGQWLGIVWMNKFIGTDGADAKEPVWFEDFNKA